MLTIIETMDNGPAVLVFAKWLETDAPNFEPGDEQTVSVIAHAAYSLYKQAKAAQSAQAGGAGQFAGTTIFAAMPFGAQLGFLLGPEIEENQMIEDVIAASPQHLRARMNAIHRKVKNRGKV